MKKQDTNIQRQTIEGAHPTRRQFIKRVSGLTISLMLVDAVPAWADPIERSEVCTASIPDTSCGKDIIGKSFKDDDESCSPGEIANSTTGGYDSDDNCGNAAGKDHGMEFFDQDGSCTKSSVSGAAGQDDKDQSCKKMKDNAFTDHDGLCGVQYGSEHYNRVNKDETCNVEISENQFNTDDSCLKSTGANGAIDTVDAACDDMRNPGRSRIGADTDNACGHINNDGWVNVDQGCEDGSGPGSGPQDPDDSCGQPVPNSIQGDSDDDGQQ